MTKEKVKRKFIHLESVRKISFKINVPWLMFADDLKLRCTFQAITRKLNDPLISQGSTRLEEDRTVVRCVTGDTMSDKEIGEMRLPPAPLVPLGRHGTECNTWLRMQLHDIDSGVRRRSGSVVKINLKQLINTVQQNKTKEGPL